MLAIVTALHCEAQPIISNLKLKRVISPAGTVLFRGEDAFLTVSGVGKVKSAIAAAALLEYLGDRSKTVLVNIGVCGSKLSHKPGEALLVNKIIDSATGRCYYPDILIRHSFKEGALETSDQPVTKMTQEVRGDVVDMEASGFCEAAFKYLSSAQIAVIKTVSDNCDAERLMKGDISSLIGETWLAAKPYCYSLLELLSSSGGATLTREELELLEKIAQGLKLTSYQRSLLKRLSLQRKSRGLELSQELFPLDENQVANKDERRAAFERITDILVA
ncbi:MAG: hypothetical protein J5J00_07505 [Deltaproteobacteria bacterium]|nr:hypothetical protein [Deltaproteobacteria bacterium]